MMQPTPSRKVQENTPALWKKVFPVPQAESHKYSRGTALIRGGAQMTGAARLAARAAQRMGAGLVTLAAPSSALPIYASTLESVIIRPSDTLQAWREHVDNERGPVLLIGPGLGLGPEQKKEVLATLDAHRPTVLDADGLTNFADEPEILFQALHDQCIITPHEGEFARLFGGGRGGERLARVFEAVEETGGIVLLKGAETAIVAPDGRAATNHNAPPWLATAGAGDVLAGMILGLIAQKMPLFEAAAAAVWLHGHIAAMHGAGLIAEDLVAGIPSALRKVIGEEAL